MIQTNHAEVWKTIKPKFFGEAETLKSKLKSVIAGKVVESMTRMRSLRPLNIGTQTHIAGIKQELHAYQRAGFASKQGADP